MQRKTEKNIEISTLREEVLRSLICGGAELFLFGEIDSTNTEAKRMVARGYCGRAILAADSQSGGRGRLGRSFFSPAESGAYFSFLYPATGRMQDAVRITCAASVAVARALQTLTGIEAGIKWVNDLYLDGRKVCGILCEAVTGGDVPMIVVGIGVNLRTQHFPAELSRVAGCLGTRADSLSREELIAGVWRELQPFINDPRDTSWLADYRSRSIVLGKEIRWIADGTEYRGVAREIGSGGELIADGRDGVQHILQTGEITLRLSD